MREHATHRRVPLCAVYMGTSDVDASHLLVLRQAEPRSIRGVEVSSVFLTR